MTKTLLIPQGGLYGRVRISPDTFACKKTSAPRRSCIRRGAEKCRQLLRQHLYNQDDRDGQRDETCDGDQDGENVRRTVFFVFQGNCGNDDRCDLCDDALHEKDKPEDGTDGDGDKPEDADDDVDLEHRAVVGREPISAERAERGKNHGDDVPYGIDGAFAAACAAEYAQVVQETEQFSHLRYSPIFYI